MTDTTHTVRHVKTDPLCWHHSPPRTRWQRWRFDRKRGVMCEFCNPASPLFPRETK